MLTTLRYPGPVRRPIHSLRAMDLLFDAMFDQSSSPRGSTPTRGFTSAAVRVVETDAAFEMRASLPGVAPEAVSIEAGPDWISVKAERRVELPEGYEAVRRERSDFSVERKFDLGARIDVDAVEARFEDGRLILTAPKLAAAAPRKITVAA